MKNLLRVVSLSMLFFMLSGCKVEGDVEINKIMVPTSRLNDGTTLYSESDRYSVFLHYKLTTYIVSHDSGQIILNVTDQVSKKQYTYIFNQLLEDLFPGDSNTGTFRIQAVNSPQTILTGSTFKTSTSSIGTGITTTVSDGKVTTGLTTTTEYNTIYSGEMQLINQGKKTLKFNFRKQY
jgi:hypothetical protein